MSTPWMRFLAITGYVGEYQSLPKTFVPGLLEDLASWIRGATDGR